MASNELSLNQASTVLNSVVAQATGKTAIAATDTSSFITVGQTVLKTGYDNTLNAISQVLSRTIFSNRPYSAKFKGLQVTEQKYGNITRKISVLDGALEDDSRQALTDGVSVDQFTVKKPGVLQTNFYGSNVYQKSLTIFRDQLDTAFSGPEQFAQFVGSTIQNATDLIEQTHEATARVTLANLIGGKIQGDSSSTVHLLTEYNALTGLTLTATSLFQPANYAAFMAWAWSRIATVSSFMAERSLKYHINVVGKEVARHSPAQKQKFYMLAQYGKQIDSMALANIYHDSKLKFSDAEDISFWQSIETPDTVKVTPIYLKAADGTLQTGTALTQGKVFGILFDEETAGFTTVNQWSANSPFNAKGGYSNMFWHFTERYWNDFTENAVVFLLD